MSAKSFLILIGDFVEDYEVMVPFQALKMIGHDVHVVCPGKKSGEKVKTAVHDFEGDQTYTEKPGHAFVLNASFASIDPHQYDALLLPGGRGPEYLRLNQKVIDLVKHFDEQKKVIGAICHGIQILTAAGILGGRKCTSYPAVGPEVSLAGGSWIEVGMDQAVVDGKLVTAPAWPAHPEWLAKILELVGTRISL